MKKSVVFILLIIGVYFNLTAQEITIFPQLGHSEGVSSLVFSSDARQILSGSWDGNVKLWETATGRKVPWVPASP